MVRKTISCYIAVFFVSCASAIPSVYLSSTDVAMELKEPAFGIASLAVSRDGNLLLTGDNGGSLVYGNTTIRIWDISRGEQIREKRYDQDIREDRL